MTDTVGTIYGRTYEVRDGGKGIRGRVIVDGIFHVGGTEKHPNTNKPIRFKSVQAAERHIRNMRLEKL